MAERQKAYPFNESRFHVPARSDRFIRRSRITTLLDAHISLPVTLVTGPPGTGKTLAVADWTLEGHAPGPVAWLSLDRDDGGISRFWASLVSALFLATPASLEELEIPDDPSADFLQAVAERSGGTLVLILDDVHELDSGTTLGWLDRLLRWPPGGVRFVLISRHDPPVTLQRLRLEGKMGELRFADLAFTASESRELMAESGVDLSPKALDRLMETTNGWAASLRLAAMTLQKAEDPSQSVEHLGGLTFLVSEYLWDEVLTLLPANYGDFLLRTSVSVRLCAPLAVALTGEPRADEILRVLAREQLLAHEVEGTGWYRTHSLLSEVLRARLKATRPELEQELHRRAALWFESNSDWAESMDHATASGDWDFAGAIAMRSGAVALLSTDRHPFIKAMARVPVASSMDHPELAVAHAIAAYSRNDDARTEALSASAMGRLHTLPEPRRSLAILSLQTVRAAQAHRRGDAIAMRSATTMAHVLLSGVTAAEAPGWSAHRGLTLVQQGLAELWAGRPGDACELLSTAVETFPAAPYNAYGEVYYRGVLALAQAASGRLTVARATADTALEAARRQGRSHSYESQWAWLALSVTLMYNGDSSAARAARQQCTEAGGHRLNPFVAGTVLVLQARQALMDGDLASARRGRATAGAALAKSPGMVAVSGLLTSFHVDLALAEGDLEGARTALAEFDGRPQGDDAGPPPRPDAVANCRARFLLAAGSLRSVRPAVEHLLEASGAEAVQAWLSVAAAEDRLRHDSLALEAMARALSLAESEGAELFILRLSRPLIAALLRHQEVVGTHRELVERALTSAGAPRRPSRTAPVAPLTERERAVLSYLTTMGSNVEIAAALSISENTVKQHLKSIYRKLSVGSRREAVRIGRETGLLDGVGGGGSAQL